MLNEEWKIYEPCGTEYLHKINEKDMFAVDFDNAEQIELDYIEFLFNCKVWNRCVGKIQIHGGRYENSKPIGTNSKIL